MAATLRPMALELPPAGTHGSKAPPSGPLIRGMMAAARLVHRLTGDKMSGQPLLHLHTVGAKSGQPRTSIVMAFPEAGDTWLVVASRGGTADHPGWLYNIAAHPDRVEVEIGGRKLAVTPQVLDDQERATAWDLITTTQPRFSGYQEQTDRQIPVVRLTAGTG